MNFMGVNWDVILSAKNYFIPCLIFLILLIALFIKYREVIFFLGICMMLIGIFEYSPWGKNINSITETVLLIISLILGGIIAGLSSRYNNKR
jgi:ABC-type proline/glycine betaine transport system permease subunit